jgi:hypothetical protein
MNPWTLMAVIDLGNRSVLRERLLWIALAAVALLVAAALGWRLARRRGP